VAPFADLASITPEALATIIPLRASRNVPAPDRALEILERRMGQGWRQLPRDAGRVGLRVEHLLSQAPARIDPETPLPLAIAQALQLVGGARAVLELLTDEVAVLSEALGADLGCLTFDDLDSVAAAVLNLGAAPSAAPAWARRAAADGAAAVLELVGPALRDARTANERVYQRFTDQVWEVPAHLLTTGRHRWRVVSRRRLRRQLRAASRARLSGSLNDIAQEIVDARVARARLVPTRTLVAHHLGDLDRGVLTDVDAAEAALDAVRRLERALGHLHDEARLEQLLLADAFRSQEVLMPAWSIRTTLETWASDVVVAGGRDALRLDGDSLAGWAHHVARELPPITAILHGPAGADAAELTLRQVVDVLVLSEHVARASDAADAPRPAEGRGAGTDRAPEGARRRRSVS
jgi:hypothetical protein